LFYYVYNKLFVTVTYSKIAGDADVREVKMFVSDLTASGII